MANVHNEMQIERLREENEQLRAQGLQWERLAREREAQPGNRAQAVYDLLNPEVERFRKALEEIRDADPTDMALDPYLAARIARHALTKEGQ